MPVATLIKECIQQGLAYSFKELAHDHHGRKCGNMHADMVVEKKMKFLHPDSQAAEVEISTLSLAWIYKRPQSYTSSKKSPLIQGHTL